MNVEPYDLLFYKGSASFISRLIRYITKSRYSHVAMYIKNGQIAEIDYKRNFGLYELDDISNYDVYRIEGLTDIQKRNIINYINNHLKVKYDYFEILRYFIYKYFKILLLDNRSKYICSEIIYDCLVESEIIKTENVEREEQKVISPEDLLEILINQFGDNFKNNKYTTLIIQERE